MLIAWQLTGSIWDAITAEFGGKSQGKAQDFSQVEHAFSHVEPKVLPTWLDRSTFKKSSLPAGSQVEHAVSQVEHVPPVSTLRMALSCAGNC